MLRRLLSKLRPNQLQTNPDSISNPPLSPNLASSFKSDFFESFEFISSATKAFQIFILALPAAFLITLFINDIVDRNLQLLVEKRDSLETELAGYAPYLEQINNVSEKLSLYSQEKGKQKIMESRVSAILTQVPSGVGLSGFTVGEGGSSLTVISAAPVDVAVLISRLLSERDVSEIVLLSADYQASDSLFKTVLEVIYK